MQFPSPGLMTKASRQSQVLVLSSFFALNHGAYWFNFAPLHLMRRSSKELSCTCSLAQLPVQEAQLPPAVGSTALSQYSSLPTASAPVASRTTHADPCGSVEAL